MSTSEKHCPSNLTNIETIPGHVLELAQELYTIIEAIETYGHGEGQITLKVQPGRNIPFIDWTFRTFRGKKHATPG